MEITEVRVALLDDPEKRLKGYATLTFDQCFVVRNIKIIEGKSGLFVAMPSRKPKVECGACHFKNDLGARHCCQCGHALTPVDRTRESPSGEGHTHRDIAHPITADFRRYLEQTLIEAYEAERVKQRGGTGTAPRGEGLAPQPEQPHVGS